MSDVSSTSNRTVWIDIPVADLDRAEKFYRGVLAVPISRETYKGSECCVFGQHDGNGACLLVDQDAITADRGILVYMNVDGRLRDALKKAEILGGQVIEDAHAIGPHGYRAVIHDSEGNRLALHSTVSD